MKHLCILMPNRPPTGDAPMLSALLLTGLLAAPITDVTHLPALPAEELRERIARQSREQKLEMLAKIKALRIAPKLSDAQISALYTGVGPDVLLDATTQWLAMNNTYEFIMRKQERVNGKLNETPDRMRVRYREHPKAVYAGWIEGGRHVGQEVLYDAAKDPGRLRAHAGGWLNLITVSLSIHSGIVKRETNHTIDEMGFKRIIDNLKSDRDRLIGDGLSIEPRSARSVVFEGVKYWENVFETPGPPRYYSKRARILFDLETGVPRLLEIYDPQGELLERIVFEQVTWAPLGDEVFSEDHPDYRF